MAGESRIEQHLTRRCKALGVLERKVKWLGRKSAPDRVLMFGGLTVWCEVKSPETIGTFPADARERAQAREHERMRHAGQTVVLVGTKEHVEQLLNDIIQAAHIPRTYHGPPKQLKA